VGGHLAGARNQNHSVAGAEEAIDQLGYLSFHAADRSDVVDNESDHHLGYPALLLLRSVTFV
jgi:hypothetical protein